MIDNQLNKLQIKAEVLTVISRLQTMPDSPSPSSIDKVLEVLLAQADKQAVLDILLKELLKTNEQKAVLICYLLLRLCDKNELETALWGILKNYSVNDFVKTIVLNLLKDMGNKVDYESFSEYFENPDEVIDADTQKLLHVAIVNPEAQIDFLDFVNSLAEKDKNVLVQSLGEDYSSDDLANILIPLFLYSPGSDIGRLALNILGSTKSQLALHALVEALEFVEDAEMISLIKKNISELKIAGVREDNAIEFYKNVLSSSKPYKSYASYPDGQGNQALIFSRKRENDTIQIVATVVNDKWGVVDCFGFNEISMTEFQRIVDRFYSGDEHICIPPSVLKSFLDNAEKLTRNTDGEISYEYICWKTLLSDVEKEQESMEDVLDNKFEKQALTKEDLEKIYMSDFVQRWFFDTEHNPSFGMLVEGLNKKFAIDNFDIDFEAAIKENLNELFDDEEKIVFNQRILTAAYLKILSEEVLDAKILYSLYYDEDKKSKLAENILRKSIYEYYVALKFKYKEEKRTTNIFTLKKQTKEKELSLKQVESVIIIIEKLWVKDV